MRDDVKIGVAIGVVLVVGALLYFMFSEPDKEEPVQEPTGSGLNVNNGGAGRSSASELKPWERGLARENPRTGSGGTSTAAAGGSAARTPTTGAGTGTASAGAGSGAGTGGTGSAGTGSGAAAGGRVDPDSGPGIISVGDRYPTGTGASGAAASGGSAASGSGSAGSAATSGSGSAGGAGAASGGTASTGSGRSSDTGAGAGTTGGAVASSGSGSSSSATGASAATQRQRTYTVVEGDAGFWGISQKEYGDGKYYVLIEKANPDKKAERLMPGDVLIIPPLPQRATPTERRGEVLSGAPAGSTTYTVQEGDAGFWGIAASLYGNGKYFHLIEAANPGIDPTRLRAGQVLVIPPKTTAASSSSGSTAAGGGETTGDGPTLGANQTSYTIQSTDSTGLWGIAKNLYGDANLYPAIEAANPGLDSTQLTPGQKIVIPSKAEAQRMVGTTGGSSSSGSDAVAEPTDGRPIFD